MQVRSQSLKFKFNDIGRKSNDGIANISAHFNGGTSDIDTQHVNMEARNPSFVSGIPLISTILTM